MAVVDASVVVDWIAPRSGGGGAADRLLDILTHEREPLRAPRLLSAEAANALVTGVRRGRWTGAEADAAFELLRALPVEIVETDADLARAWELSRRFDEHPIYDLLYVAVAERLTEPFYTADRALVERLRSMTFVHLVA